MPAFDEQSMGMAVVHVGIVRMCMHERCMNVPVSVRLAVVPRELVRMPVVLVVRVVVRVFLPLVRVQMPVLLRQVQPDTPCHQYSCCDELE